MQEKKQKTMECQRCGDPFLATADRLLQFHSEAAEKIYCPNCHHQKHYGVIHSE